MLLDLNRFSFSVFLKEVRLLTALALPMLWRRSRRWASVSSIP